jgi:hypothetical protein
MALLPGTGRDGRRDRYGKVPAPPAGDWHRRLWADFVLDVAAAHSLLGDDGTGRSVMRHYVYVGQDTVVGAARYPLGPDARSLGRFRGE